VTTSIESPASSVSANDKVGRASSVEVAKTKMSGRIIDLLSDRPSLRRRCFIFFPLFKFVDPDFILL
jgi:hypothetical protein